MYYKSWSELQSDEKIGLSFSNYKNAVLKGDIDEERKWNRIMKTEIKRQQKKEREIQKQNVIKY